MTHQNLANMTRGYTCLPEGLRAKVGEACSDFTGLRRTATFDCSGTAHECRRALRDGIELLGQPILDVARVSSCCS